jgi:DNA-binding beta-propeller fold protein YncE
MVPLAVLAGPLRAAILTVPPLQQLPGTAGCVSETGTGGACADGNVLTFPQRVEVSPDGRSLYVTSQVNSLLTCFDRDPSTGQLTQKIGAAMCISETGSAGLCADGMALGNPRSMAVSPDGRNVYVAASASEAVVVLDRDITSGALTQKAGTAGCVSETGTGGACTDGVALAGAIGVAISPDGKSVYVAGAGNNDAVAVFDRNPSTGALTQKMGLAACVSESGSSGNCVNGAGLDGADAVVVSADGRSVYVASLDSDAVAIFDRDPMTGALTQKAGEAGCASETGPSGVCADAMAIDAPQDVAVSPDGRSVYTASSVSDAVAVFDRDPATGALTQKAGMAGCVSDTGSGGACIDGKALNGAVTVVVSPDGASVYVGSVNSDAVAVFDRDPATGALTQKAGTAACVSETGSAGLCMDGVALNDPTDLVMSADGRDVYLAAQLSDAVVALARDLAAYDIDGDGEAEPLTDGLLLLRYLFGFRGGTLATGAIDLVDCTRCGAADVEGYIGALLGP